ncbi:hypothetical protein EXIGLDRAFT_764238 [Exidia glandulosa HHB12029]|uniref:F-box domain-containing protein n=1 Tax=Exidia glandulosa HHB12029 TaxID=1314781 RepID=A0A165LA13_EXIGL|nr:hypothetical protein EXIGLDRAFT_764238 [Exidia glandulosa HHB12029]
MLQRLEIRLAYTGKTAPLNQDIFAGTCPKLRDVFLSRVPLLDRGYPAFQSVTRIEFGRRPVYRFSTISQVFPRAQRLNMILDSLSGDAPPPQHVPARPPHLTRLRIWTTLNVLPPEVTAVLSASPPIADVELDWWSGMRFDSAVPEYISISEYLQNMNGPLDLSVFSIDGGGFTTDIVLLDLKSGVKRTFREPQLLESDNESNRRALRGQDIVTYNFTEERFRPGLSMIVALHIEPLFWNEIDDLTRRLPALQLVELLVHGCPKNDSVIDVDRWMNQDDHFPVPPIPRAESCRVVELKITAKPKTPGLKIRAFTILRLIRHCHFLGPDVRARVTLENVSRIPCEYDGVLGSVAC